MPRLGSVKRSCCGIVSDGRWSWLEGPVPANRLCFRRSSGHPVRVGPHDCHSCAPRGRVPWTQACQLGHHVTALSSICPTPVLGQVSDQRLGTEREQAASLPGLLPRCPWKPAFLSICSGAPQGATGHGQLSSPRRQGEASSGHPRPAGSSGHPRPPGSLGWVSCFLQLTMYFLALHSAPTYVHLHGCVCTHASAHLCDAEQYPGKPTHETHAKRGGRSRAPPPGHWQPRSHKPARLQGSVKVLAAAGPAWVCANVRSCVPHTDA